MNPVFFLATLSFAIIVVTIAMLYLRRTTRRVIVELCRSEAGAEFWLRSSDILAYSGALILVLSFGYNPMAQNFIDVLRITLILTLSGIFLVVMFVARHVWKTVLPGTGEKS